MSVKWGIIGCGKVVEDKVGPAFSSINGSELVAVMRRDESAAQRSAKILGAKHAFSSVEELLDSGLINAAYIATPPGLHFSQALECCKRKIPVYIEKPFTRNFTEANKLVEEFNSVNTPLFVAHYRRALPRFLKIKETLESGEIGEIKEVDFRLSRKYSEHPWLYNPEISGGGKFFDIAPHTIDLLIFLFGEFSEISSNVINFSEPNGTEDLVTAIFQTESVAGTINFNLNSLEKSDHMIITGTAGSIQFSVHGNSPIAVQTTDSQYKIDSPNPSFIETPMIREVVNYLSGLPAAPCFGKDALPTVLVIDNILEKFYGGRQRDFWRVQL